MKLIPESNRLEDYLQEIEGIIDFSSPILQKKIEWIENQTEDLHERAKIAFEYARDDIGHSFDTKYEKVTISASATIQASDGICFAKSHVLAALLRGMGIPTGFSYQRVVRQGTVESGHALHGLNAIYFEEIGWFRVDPRGNKSGIASSFSMTEEKLAYPIRPEMGEIDYPNIFIRPLESVICAMESAANSTDLFYKRPEKI